MGRSRFFTKGETKALTCYAQNFKLPSSVGCQRATHVRFPHVETALDLLFETMSAM